MTLPNVFSFFFFKSHLYKIFLFRESWSESMLLISLSLHRCYPRLLIATKRIFQTDAHLFPPRPLRIQEAFHILYLHSCIYIFSFQNSKITSKAHSWRMYWRLATGTERTAEGKLLRHFAISSNHGIESYFMGIRMSRISLGIYFNPGHKLCIMIS